MTSQDCAPTAHLEGDKQEVGPEQAEQAPSPAPTKAVEGEGGVGGIGGGLIQAAKAFEAEVAAASAMAAGADGVETLAVEAEAVEPPTPHAAPRDFVACAGPGGDLKLMAEAATVQADLDNATTMAMTAELGSNQKKLKNDAGGPDSVVPLSESQKALMEIRNTILGGKITEAQAGAVSYLQDSVSVSVRVSLSFSPQHHWIRNSSWNCDVCLHCCHRCPQGSGNGPDGVPKLLEHQQEKAVVLAELL